MQIAEKVIEMLGQDQPLKVLREKRQVALPFDAEWTQISNEAGVDLHVLHKLNPKLAWIKDPLRKGTIINVPGKALDVSYTQQGLKWATDALGRNLYYGKHVDFNSNIHRKGVYVENFIPRNHYRTFKSISIHKYLQRSEFNACDKALRLLYESSFNFYQ